MKFAELTTALAFRPAGVRWLLWNMLILVWGGTLLSALSDAGASGRTPTWDASNQIGVEVPNAGWRVVEYDKSSPLSQSPFDTSPAVASDTPSANSTESVRQSVSRVHAVTPEPRRLAAVSQKEKLTAEQAGEQYVKLRDAAAEDLSRRLGGRRQYAYGGHEARERPTLAWLEDHQNPEGYWSAAWYGDDSTRTHAFRTGCIDAGEVSAAAATFEDDVAVTALALLNFVGSGYDHKAGDYRITCRNCLLWLRKISNVDGSIDAVYSIQTYARVAMAWSECYGLSGDQVLKPLAERAVAYLLSHQHKGSGWSDSARQDPDLLSTSIAILALQDARMAGLEFDHEAPYPSANAFFDKIADDNYSPLDAGCWILATLFTGHTDLKDERILERAKLLTRDENLVKWEAGHIDFLYWWIASMALYQVGGESWKKWEKTMTATLLDHQRGYHAKDKAEGHTSGQVIDEHGSWDPIDPQNKQGRLFTTTVGGLTMEVYYRYCRLQE